MGVNRRLGHIAKDGCYFAVDGKLTHIRPMRNDELNVPQFLALLYQRGLGYSAINTARSIVSSFMSVNQEKTVGQWPLMKLFLKGIFNHKPSLPRYQRNIYA